MWRNLVIGLIIVALGGLEGCGTTVNPGQRGLRWYPLSGGLQSETLNSGFYWRAPWNDVYAYDVRLQSYTELVDALSADDLLVKLKAAIIMRPIADEMYFLAQEIGPDFYPRVPIFANSMSAKATLWTSRWRPLSFSTTTACTLLAISALISGTATMG